MLDAIEQTRFSGRRMIFEKVPREVVLLELLGGLGCQRSDERGRGEDVVVHAQTTLTRRPTALPASPIDARAGISRESDEVIKSFDTARKDDDQLHPYRYVHKAAQTEVERTPFVGIGGQVSGKVARGKAICSVTASRMSCRRVQSQHHAQHGLNRLVFLPVVRPLSVWAQPQF